MVSEVPDVALVVCAPSPDRRERGRDAATGPDDRYVARDGAVESSGSGRVYAYSMFSRCIVLRQISAISIIIKLRDEAVNNCITACLSLKELALL